MKFFLKSHNAEKIERRDPLGFFNIRSVGKLQKIEGGTLWEFFFRKKVSQSRKYSLVPLSFLDDVKILLRKLLKYFFLNLLSKNCKIVRILRKVDRSV